MAIVKDVEITIEKGVAKTSEDIILYKGDDGIRFDISIYNLNTSIVKIRSIYNLNLFSFVDISVVKPNNSKLFFKDVPVVDGKISFNVDGTMTDVVGKCKYQIRLRDGESRLTIPPCTYDVLEPIAIYV